MKKWYQSKTVIFNIVTVALGIVQVISGTFPIPTELLSVIMGVGNVILRFVTVDGIEKSVM